MQHLLLDLTKGRYVKAATEFSLTPKVEEALVLGSKETAQSEAVKMPGILIPVRVRKGQA